jgi:hypothetical protein
MIWTGNGRVSGIEVFPATYVGAKRSRPAFWILLTFVTMMAPALVCFSKLKRERRHLYRHSLTDLQKA